MLRDICEIYNPVAEERGMSISVSAPDALKFVGNRQSVGRAVANLVDNALHYGGGAIELGASATDGTIALSVSDRGPGIPPELREDRKSTRLNSSHPSISY